MSEILFQHKNQPELRFIGQLIAETEFSVDLDDNAIRKFNLRAFAIDGGGFVAVLQYQTTSDSEENLLSYEDMDQFKDVENFFYVFEANEVFRNFDALRRSDREAAGLICKRIAKAYESSLFKFLDVLRSRCQKQNLADRMEEKPKPSILRTLGLKR